MRYMEIEFLAHSYRPRFLLFLYINITFGALFTGYIITQFCYKLCHVSLKTILEASIEIGSGRSDARSLQNARECCALSVLGMMVQARVFPSFQTDHCL